VKPRPPCRTPAITTKPPRNWIVGNSRGRAQGKFHLVDRNRAETGAKAQRDFVEGLVDGYIDVEPTEQSRVGDRDRRTGIDDSEKILTQRGDGEPHHRASNMNTVGERWFSEIKMLICPSDGRHSLPQADKQRLVGRRDPLDRRLCCGQKLKRFQQTVESLGVGHDMAVVLNCNPAVTKSFED
jgi:hypothetical protein